MVQATDVVVAIDNNEQLPAKARQAFPVAKVVANAGAHGLSGGRTTGASNTDADVLVFVDDVAFSAPELLEQRLLWFSPRPGSHLADARSSSRRRSARSSQRSRTRGARTDGRGAQVIARSPMTSSLPAAPLRGTSPVSSTRSIWLGRRTTIAACSRCRRFSTTDAGRGAISPLRLDRQRLDDTPRGDVVVARE